MLGGGRDSLMVTLNFWLASASVALAVCSALAGSTSCNFPKVQSASFLQRDFGVTVNSSPATNFARGLRFGHDFKARRESQRAIQAAAARNEDRLNFGSPATQCAAWPPPG